MKSSGNRYSGKLIPISECKAKEHKIIRLDIPGRQSLISQPYLMQMLWNSVEIQYSGQVISNQDYKFEYYSKFDKNVYVLK